MFSKSEQAGCTKKSFESERVSRGYIKKYDQLLEKQCIQLSL